MVLIELPILLKRQGREFDPRRDHIFGRPNSLFFFFLWTLSLEENRGRFATVLLLPTVIHYRTNLFILDLYCMQAIQIRLSTLGLNLISIGWCFHIC